jgi:hypothetical protein
MNVLTTAANPLTKYKWAAIVLVVVLWHVAYGAFWNRHGKLELQHEIDAERIATAQEANRMERARQRGVDEAARAAAARAAGQRADLARVADERDGLQHALAIARERGEKSLDACRQHAATLEAVFAECRGRYEAVGRDAAGHASDSLMLQEAWPK